MSKNITTIEKSAIEYLCGLIRDVVSLPSEIISNINLADNLTFSNIYIKDLVEQCLIDAKDYADLICGSLIKLTCKKTTVQPTLDNSELNIIYLFSSDGNAPYEQYLKISDAELIDMGSTSISLNDYLTVTDAVSTYAKKVDLDTLTTEVTNIKSDFNTHKNDTDIHITSAERTKWDEVDLKANDDEVVKKTDVATSISKTSTDNTVPSTKAIYNKSKNKITEILNGEDIIAYADGISHETVTDTVRIMNATNSPYGVDNKDNDFHYTIYNITDDNFKRIVAYDIRKNDMYMIMKSVGVWGTWQRVCTTSVADVGKTNITSRLVNATVTSGGGVLYSVKNGMCYVQFAGVTTTTTSSGGYILSTGTLPHVNTSLSNGHYPVADASSINGLVVVEGNTGGVRYYGGVMTIFTTISYPVKES